MDRVTWWPYVGAYLYSVGVGKLFIDPLMKELVRGLVCAPGEDSHRQRASMVGVLERALYTASWHFGKPEFIAVWLALKTAGQWSRWAEDREEKSGIKVPGRAFFNVFLIGSGFSVCYAVVGGVLPVWISTGRILQSILVGGAVVVLTAVFRFWAGRIVPGDTERSDLD